MPPSCIDSTFRLRFIKMRRKLISLIKLFFFCSCLFLSSSSPVNALQDNPFLTKDFANLFTSTPSPTTSTTTQIPSTSTFPPPFNLPFQFTAPSSSSSSSSSSSQNGINWNYPSVFKYQSTTDKAQRQESSTSNSNNNYHSNSIQKRPVVAYGKAPIELYTMMSMKKGRYFPPPEDNDGYSGLVPSSGPNVLGPSGRPMGPGMEPSMGSGFAAMQGMEAAPSMGYDMGGGGGGYPGQGIGSYGGGMGGYSGGFGGGMGMAAQQYPAVQSYGSGLGMSAQQYPAVQSFGAPSAYAAAPSFGIPSFGAAPAYGTATPNFGMSSPYGITAPMSMGMSPMAMQYASPSYLGFPNMQPAASSIYSAYSGYGGGYPATATPHHFGYGIGGYGSGMYPITSGLLGAASHTMGTILNPFAALAQPRYPHSLFPFG